MIHSTQETHFLNLRSSPSVCNRSSYFKKLVKSIWTANKSEMGLQSFMKDHFMIMYPSWSTGPVDCSAVSGPTQLISACFIHAPTIISHPDSWLQNLVFHLQEFHYRDMFTPDSIMFAFSKMMPKQNQICWRIHGSSSVFSGFQKECFSALVTTSGRIMLFQCILVSLRSEEIILSDSWWKFAMFIFYFLKLFLEKVTF